MSATQDDQRDVLGLSGPLKACFALAAGGLTFVLPVMPFVLLAASLLALYRSVTDDRFRSLARLLVPATVVAAIALFVLLGASIPVTVRAS